MLKRIVIIVMLAAVFSSISIAVEKQNAFLTPKALSEPTSIIGLDDDIRFPQLIKNPIKQKYAPNELIVKFKETVADSIARQVADKKSAKDLRMPSSLYKLNVLYNAKEIKPLAKNFKAKKAEIEALRTKDKSQLTVAEKHLLKRLERAPKDGKDAALDRIYKLTFELGKGQNIEDIAAAYQNDPDVEYAELNYIVSVCNTPGDSLYSTQWPLNNTGQTYPAWGVRFYETLHGTAESDINAPEAWDISSGSSDIVVAVIDSGVDYNHRDLQGNMWTDANGCYGYDFCNNDNDPIDDLGHGTHCAGIIAARGNNSTDMTGVSWNAKIMAVKFLGWDGYGEESAAVEAINYAVNNGADILSNSWGAWEPSQAVEDAIDYAYSNGVIVVAAAGNLGFGAPAPNYPAYYDHVIAVAATDSNDNKASFSNYGEWVEVAAPGADILSLRGYDTWMGNVYNSTTTVASGTSMACPHVAGICALMLSVNGSLSPDDVNVIIGSTGDPIADGTCHSDQRVNAYKAMLGSVKSKGYINIDRGYYGYDCNINIIMCDIDLAGQGTHDVNVTSSSGDLEKVTLTEFGSNTGIFKGTIFTSEEPNDPNDPDDDGLLEISNGVTITATYQDANDGSGNSVNISDTAEADCIYPVTSDVQFDTSAIGPDPAVTFDTNENTTFRILCGEASNNLEEIIKGNLQFSKAHSIKLSGVSPNATYYFKIEITDIAGNITIDDNGTNLYSFTTDAGPRDMNVPDDYNTIQAAIDASWNGATVWIEDGNYTGTGNRDLDLKGKAITVRSKNGPGNCIINCQADVNNPHRGFYFHTFEDVNSVISGLKIINGYAPRFNFAGYAADAGGAICCSYSSPNIINCVFQYNKGQLSGAISNYYNSSTLTDCTFAENGVDDCVPTRYGSAGAVHNFFSNATIDNCIFTQNWNLNSDPTGSLGAGGIFCIQTPSSIKNCQLNSNTGVLAGGIASVDASSIVENCLFNENEADQGGGIWSVNYPLEVKNCIFNANHAAGYGAGVFKEKSTATITNCLFTGNDSGSYGGGIFNARYCNTTVTNCTFSKNNATSNAGGIGTSTTSNTAITNCVFWDDTSGGSYKEIYDEHWSYTAVTYSDIKGGYSGTGNINSNPSFADSDNPAGADGILGTQDDGLRLLISSPCIDSGDGNSAPSMDILGSSRQDIPSVSNTGTGVPNYSDMGTYEFHTIWYVKADAGGRNNGSSWSNAFINLQDAISLAAAGDEIWVAEGTYKPTDGSSRTISFELSKNISLYGGFGGSETSRSQRNWDTNETILSGDIGTANDATDNSYHVLKTTDADTIIIDGFTITKGYANGTSPNNGGGAIYNTCGDTKVANCKLSDNSATYGGAIMSMASSGSTISHCTFSGNSATNGGAIDHGNDVITLNDCQLSGNSATSGGAIMNGSSSTATVNNCTFSDNSAANGGATYNSNAMYAADYNNCVFSGNYVSGAANCSGGAMYNTTNAPAITNCVFYGNYASGTSNSYGGAICNYTSSPTVKNCTFNGNYASGSSSYGGALRNQYGSSPTIVNCIIWGNTATNGANINNYLGSTPVITYSDIEGGYSGTGNINSNPNFVDANNPVGNDAIWGTNDDGLIPAGGSPCIDAANGNSAPSTDIIGRSRIDNPNTTNTGTGDPNYADVGSYEYDPN